MRQLVYTIHHTVSLVVNGKFGKTSKSLKILWNWLEDPSPREIRLSLTGHQPSISWCPVIVIIVIIIITIIIFIIFVIFIIIIIIIIIIFIIFI